MFYYQRKSQKRIRYRSWIGRSQELLEPEAQREAELRFVKELQEQGFLVYHREDYEALEKQIAETTDERTALELGWQRDKCKNNCLYFYTEDELADMIINQEGPIMNPLVSLYLAGADVPEWGELLRDC